MQPVPSHRVLRAAVATIDHPRLSAAWNDLLARHAEVFSAEPNVLNWSLIRAGAQYQSEAAPTDLGDVLARFDGQDVEQWSLRVAHREPLQNYANAYYPPSEWVVLTWDRATGALSLEVSLVGRARAEVARDILLGAVNATTPEVLARQRRLDALAELRVRLDQLEHDPALTPSKRGKAFETWLADLLGLYGYEVKLDVQNSTEQIDLTYWNGPQFVMIEARWIKEKVDAPQVREFAGKLLTRPAFAVGLLISVSGFTATVVQEISRQAGVRTIVPLDRDDLHRVLAGNPELPEWFANALRARLEHP